MLFILGSINVNVFRFKKLLLKKVTSIAFTKLGTYRCFFILMLFCCWFVCYFVVGLFECLLFIKTDKQVESVKLVIVSLNLFMF